MFPVQAQTATVAYRSATCWLNIVIDEPTVPCRRVKFVGPGCDPPTAPELQQAWSGSSTAAAQDSGDGINTIPRPKGQSETNRPESETATGIREQILESETRIRNQGKRESETRRGRREQTETELQSETSFLQGRVCGGGLVGTEQVLAGGGRVCLLVEGGFQWGRDSWH